MPLILGTNSIKDTGYDVANSLRFNRGSSDSLERTPSSAGNRRTFTFSCWFKLGKIASSTSDFYQLFGQTDASGSSNDGLWIDSNDRLYVFFNSGERRITNQRLRDVSSWYHVVLAIDTTQSTASNRIKLYLNGSEITSFSTNTDPTLNHESGVNNTSTAYIGERINDDFLDGYMAEVVMIDGQQLDPTSFGEFDSDSPNIWKPKDVSGLTFGTNGFYLDFENASSLGADVSGNSNNFTVNNLTSVDQSTDTCTNNYATFNSLLNTNGTLSEGNLQAQSPASGGNGGISTFGASKGKWYAEFKQVAESTANEGALAVIDTTFLHNSTLTSAYLEYTAGTYGLRDGLSSGVGFYTSGGSVTSNSSFHGNWTTNDIIGIALDIDNNRVYFSKNGQWTDGSGNYDESNPTGYLTIQSDHGEGTYMFAVGDSSSANNVTWQGNFGSPPFSISSGNSDANGYGNFEYPVPSGYYALNSKNLAEFG
tara:strand:+ start:104 stop:1543 length:1440 start_codon:yes stop_codon:yes gene_type:complete